MDEGVKYHTHSPHAIKRTEGGIIVYLSTENFSRSIYASAGKLTPTA
jgi:hypothetical protein